MKAVEINEYGPVEVLTVNERAPMPEIAPHEVLIRNKATSVNPIDALKRTGYGRVIFEKKRRPKFPWIMGNDAAGVITRIGRKVSTFKINDEVFCALSGFKQGAWAEYIAVPADAVAKKPANLSFEEAASIPYVALTTWAALVDRGGLSPGAGAGKKALVHAGSGGVGSFAIQFLKSWRWHVAATCSTRNVEMVKRLGADEVVDYTQFDFCDMLKDYHLVYDTIGVNVSGYEENSISILQPNAGAAYISIVHPVISTLDQNGLLVGGLKIIATLIAKKLRNRKIGYHWSVFRPNGRALETIRRYIEAGRIKPVIDKLYTLQQMSEAHQYIETGHARGKVVIQI